MQKVAAIRCSPETTCPCLQVLLAQQTAAAACALHQIPIVGTVLSTSPICNLYKIVVLPAASRPNMTTCTSTEGSQNMHRMLRIFPVECFGLLRGLTRISRLPNSLSNILRNEFPILTRLAKLSKSWLLSLQCLHGFTTIVLSTAAAQRAVLTSSSDGSVLLYGGAAQWSSRSLQLFR